MSSHSNKTTPPDENKILVEVIYARKERQDRRRVWLPPSATVLEAINSSGVLEHHPEISLSTNKIGIYGKLVKADAPVRDRDRVEIYRPLIADPKEVRKQRAAQGKVMKKGSDDPV